MRTTHHAATRMMTLDRFVDCLEMPAIALLLACRDLCVCAGSAMVAVVTNAEVSDVVEGEEVATREHCRRRGVCAAAALENQEVGQAPAVGWR